MNKSSIILCLAVLTSWLCSCNKEVLVTRGEVIASKEVPAQTGDFSIYVKTTGVWSASTIEDWLHVSSTLAKDNSVLQVRYDSNESYEGAPRFNRLGHVVISTYDGATADTVLVRQKGIEPFIEIDSCQIPAAGGICIVPVRTNLTGAQRGGMSFVCDASWISSVEWSADGAGIRLEASAGSGREASLSFSFTDDWGVTTKTECLIKQ